MISTSFMVTSCSQLSTNNDPPIEAPTDLLTKPVINGNLDSSSDGFFVAWEVVTREDIHHQTRSPIIRRITQEDPN